MPRKIGQSHPRHPLYSGGSVSIDADATVEWSQVVNTPTTRDGYGITDVYTEAEADALFLTAAAADLLFLTPAEGDALFLTPAEGNAAYSLLGHNHDAAYAALAHSHDLDDLNDVVLTAPADGDILMYDLASGDWINVAPAGGAPHALDAHTDVDTTGVSAGDVLTYDGADWIAQAPAAAGIDGTGSALYYARFVDADTVEPGNLVDAGSNVQLVDDTADTYYEFQPGNVTPGQSATNPGYMIGSEDASGALFIRSRWSGNMLMQIDADEDAVYFGGDGNVHATIERAMIKLERDTTNLAFGRVALDNFQFRWNDDGAGNQLDATKPSWAFALGEGADDRFNIYRRPAGGAYVGTWRVTNSHHWVPNVDASQDLGASTLRLRTVYSQQLADGATGTQISSSGTVFQVAAGSDWTQLNFYTGATARWHIVSSGHFFPVADNTYDIGSAALSVRDLFIDGEAVGMNGSNVKTADQASFANALTDITNTSWAVGTNEVWEFDIFIPYTTNATAGTVGWTVNGPAGTTVAYQVFGTTTALTAYLTAYSTTLNTGTGAVGALVSSAGHFVWIKGRLSTVGTGGTAIARGITSAAGKTVVAKNGAWVSARRIS